MTALCIVVIALFFCHPLALALNTSKVTLNNTTNELSWEEEMTSDALFAIIMKSILGGLVGAVLWQIWEFLNNILLIE